MDPQEQIPLLFPPPTQGQLQVTEAMQGLAVGLFVWMLLGAPGFGDE